MKSLLLLHCYLLLIGYCLANNDGNCDIEGITTVDWQSVYTISINDTQIETDILTLPYTGDLVVVKVESDNATLFDVTTEDDNFVIKTTSAFTDFDKNTAKQQSTSNLITLQCTLTCADGNSSLTVRILVTDINSHPPEFDSDTYEYMIASPIMPLIDFTIYGSGIVATDIDFSNQDITFTIDPDDFSIETVSSSSSKDYSAVFSAKSVVQFIGNRTYTITATDSGTIPGPLSSSTTITLIVDEALSLDTPAFESASYSYNYTVDGTSPKLVLLDGPITIDTNKPSSLSDPTLTGDFKDYFEVQIVGETVEVTAKELLPSEAGSFIVLGLTVSTDNTAVTSLVVYLVDNDETVQFNSHYFTGSYNDTDNTVTLDSVIEITSSSTPTLNLTGDEDYAQYFEVNQEGDEYVVSVSSTGLPSTILSSSVSLPLTLVATTDGAVAYATLVINLPRATKSGAIQFAQTLYNGIYQVADDETVIFEVSESIEVETEEDDANVEYNISDDYKEYFGLSYSNKVLSVIKTKNLPDEVLSSNSFISLVLTVGISGTTDTSSAVLNVEIDFSGNDTSAIEFSSVVYSGKYVVTDGTGVFTQDEPVTITTDESDDNVEAVITNEYKSYFNVTYADKTVTLHLVNQLPSDVLASNTFIPITLQVSITGTSRQSSAVLNVRITYDEDEDLGSIDFSSALYTAEYVITDGRGNLTLNEEIQVVTDATDNQVEASISDGSPYKEYFNVTYDDHSLLVQLLKDLPDDALTNHIIALTLTVTISETTHRSSAVLNIYITDTDESRSVEFSDILYNGKYTVTDGEGELIVTDQITIVTDESDSNIEVTVSNEYDSYFSVSYSNNTATVELEKQLSTSIVNSSSFIPVTLLCSIKGTSHQSSAVLNIAIEYDGDNDTGLIQFSTILYNAEYSVDDDGKGYLEFYNDIKVISDRTDDEIEASLAEGSGLENYFTISYASHIITVELKENIPEDVLTKNSFIALTMTIGITGTTQTSSAVLNIDIYNDSDDNNGSDGTGSKTGYIAAISVLSLLLIILIAAVVAYYILRLRSGSYNNLEEEDGRVRFNKNSLKRSSSDLRPASSLDERRPTGFIFNPINDESVDGDSIGGSEKGRRKSVAFDDNVEKLQLEANNDGDNVSVEDNDNVDDTNDDTEVDTNDDRYVNENSETTHV